MLAEIQIEDVGKSGGGWDVRPFQIVSLLDMLRFAANWFYHATTGIDRHICDFGKAMQKRGNDSLLTDDEIKYLTADLSFTRGHCERLGLKRAKEVIDDIQRDVDSRDTLSYLTLVSVWRPLLGLRTAIVRDLEEHVFLALSEADRKYYDQKELFGSDVFANFESARDDIIAAGNCYATGNYSASVFHLMRVAEIGMRALVKKLGNRKVGGRKLGIDLDGKPIELATWDAISKGVKKAIDRLPNSKSIAITREKEFYSAANAQFHNFKDAWRNHVSHTRDPYDEHKAMSVMVNVRQFMQHLASNLKEQG